MWCRIEVGRRVIAAVCGMIARVEDVIVGVEAVIGEVCRRRVPV